MRTSPESAALTDAAEWARSQHASFVSDLARFVAFPSISAQPAHAGDMQRCASWLASHLGSIGLDAARVIQTSGHPLAYAEWLHEPGHPTLLIYGHYDVQPPEPLSEWRTPPFHPEVARGRLFGRGASDDKGQMFAHVKALESWLATRGRLPVNVRCVFEGEEEIGSAGFLSFIEERPDQFRSDLALVSDTPMGPGGQPAITYSLRGALSVEIETSRTGRDLHSGAYGGAIHNPAQALCEILASLHDAEGQVSIPGFYARVRNWSSEERAYMAQNGPTDQDLLHEMQASEEWGEDSFSLYERITIRPAVTINGIAGGYRGVGAKAVIPTRAAAKLNFRLAPDQDPTEVYAQLRRHIENIAPIGVRITTRRQMAARPVVMDRTHRAIRAAAWACRQGFRMPPRFLRAGGTIPVVNAFRELLRTPVVLMGFASAEDALHAPNESFSLRTFARAIDTSIAFLQAAGSMGHSPQTDDSLSEVPTRQRVQPRNVLLLHGTTMAVARQIRTDRRMSPQLTYLTFGWNNRDLARLFALRAAARRPREGGPAIVLISLAPDAFERLRRERLIRTMPFDPGDRPELRNRHQQVLEPGGVEFLNRHAERFTAVPVGPSDGRRP